ncbi:MAG: ArnT family glycosyltransferase [Acidimicrobiia bacterium]
MPALVGAVLVLVATRRDPFLSSDSITYLSAADHVRDGEGLTDFALKPVTIFAPVFPLLLAPGGRSLVWASIVGAISVAVAAALMWLLLRERVRPLAALAGATAFGASQGMVRMGSVVWSEAPYAAISMATLLVLTRRAPTRRLAAIAGLFAGVGFLTRYAGIGLIATGAVVVALASWRSQDRDRVEVMKCSAAYLMASLCVGGVWIVRNLAETGEPLGPRFEGGASEHVTRTIRLALIGTAHIVVGDGWSATARARIGAAIIVALCTVAFLSVRSARFVVIDVAVAVFGATSFVVPIVARQISANDIELRVMSPMLIPVVYFTAVVFDRWCTVRVAAMAGSLLLGVWLYHGVAFAARFPDRASDSSGYEPQFAPQLYEAIDTLPTDATILTNSPQRVWWFTDREPTLLAFTRPRAGNSHYPLDVHHTLALACNGHAYLAWFDGLANAGEGPAERRPDLVQLVDLQLERSVPGGELYLLRPVDANSCTTALATNGRS